MVFQPGWDTASPAEIADRVAELVGVLGRRLDLAAGQAVDPGDRRACAHAARQAHQVYELLAPGG